SAAASCFSAGVQGNRRRNPSRGFLMSTIDERRERTSAGVAREHDGDGWYEGFARPRVVLQPIAAPSVLGLFGFAGATLIVASNLAGWWGSETSTPYLAPFAATFGGLAQFMAGMWSFRARDVLATAMHGMWGAFWIAWGILQPADRDEGAAGSDAGVPLPGAR